MGDHGKDKAGSQGDQIVDGPGCRENMQNPPGYALWPPSTREGYKDTSLIEGIGVLVWY